MNKCVLSLISSALFANVPAFGKRPQAPPPIQQQTEAAAAQPAPPLAKAAPNDGKIRIYVAKSQSWEVRGSWGASYGSGGGGTDGGARPQTAEIIKTFNQRCPQYIVTNDKERANYAVLLDHEGGKGLLRHRNKIVVFNRDGDAIFSNSTLELGNSVKDACAAIAKDIASQKK